MCSIPVLCSMAASRALELRSSRDTGARTRPTRYGQYPRCARTPHMVLCGTSRTQLARCMLVGHGSLKRTCNEPSYLRSGPCLLGIAAPKLLWVLKAPAGGGGASLACASRRSVPPLRLRASRFARRRTLSCLPFLPGASSLLGYSKRCWAPAARNRARSASSLSSSGVAVGFPAARGSDEDIATVRDGTRARRAIERAQLAPADARLGTTPETARSVGGDLLTRITVASKLIKTHEVWLRILRGVLLRYDGCPPAACARVRLTCRSRASH